MSIVSSSYKPKSFQESSDLQDLKQQLQILSDENKILTAQLQELIEVNNELTTSIEQYSKLHQQKFGPIDQSQLQELANQVNALQQELQEQREKTYEMIMKNAQQPQSPKRRSGNHSRQSSRQMVQQVEFNVDQIFQVIKQLTNSIHYLQQQFRQQIQTLYLEFTKQSQQSQQIIKQMQQKILHFQQLYKQLIAELQNRDQTIANMGRQLELQRTKKSQMHKQMKISLTIQDLKHTLERKIQQKEQVIKAYQALLADLKNKFQQFTISNIEASN